ERGAGVAQDARRAPGAPEAAHLGSAPLRSTGSPRDSSGIRLPAVSGLAGGRDQVAAILALQTATCGPASEDRPSRPRTGCRIAGQASRGDCCPDPPLVRVVQVGGGEEPPPSPTSTPPRP